MELLRRLIRLVPRWDAWLGRRRRDLVLARARLGARLHAARLDVDVADDVTFGRRVQVLVTPGSDNRLQLGPGSRLHDEVVIQLRGGTVEMEADTALRLGTLLNVAGHLTMKRNSELSYYNVVHCSERVLFEEFAGCSERVTVTDSRHFHAGEAEWFYHNVESAPVRIGRNTWLATNVVVAAGVTIGPETIVSANSTVTRDLPGAVLAGGSPAARLRDNPTRQDWLDARAETAS